MRALKNLDLSSFNTENVTKMDFMFLNCKSLNSVDISSFNTKKVTDMSSMFQGCQALTKLDLSKFDTQNVTKMSNTFSLCKSLKSLGISKFNTQNVTDMDSMFYMCQSLPTLDLSEFNTENVTSMSYMFCLCSSLVTLDVSNFNTKKVTDMSNMFGLCDSLTTIYSNDTWYCDKSESMFNMCNKLKGAVSYNSSKNDVSMANPKTGYFTMTTNKMGDVNGDGIINLSDVIGIARYVVGNSLAPFSPMAADMNGDGSVTIADGVSLINYIANDFEKSSITRRAKAEEATAVASLLANSEKLNLCTQYCDRYTAVEFTLSLPVGYNISQATCIDNATHQILINKIAEGKYRVVVFSFDNDPFMNDDVVSVTFNGEAPLSAMASDIIFVTPDGRSVHCSNTVASTVTSVDGDNGVNNRDVQWYDLNGRRLSAPLKGSVSVSKGIKILRK